MHTLQLARDLLGTTGVRLVFDRGTVVLQGGEETASISEVPGFLWDPRVRAHRAPAWRYTEVASGLATCGVRFSDEVGASAGQPDAWRELPLRRYQQEALDTWLGAGRRGLVVLPTGSGKTRLGLAAMARVAGPALCLVPTRVLLDQWRREIATFYRGEVGQLGDGARHVAPVTVATFESAYRHMHWLGNRFELLLVDEAHHFGGGMRDEALEMSIAGARLGLTATPPGEGSAAERLAVLLGPVIYELAIGDLAGTFLASFEAVTLRLDLTAGERARYDRLVADFRTVFDEYRGQAPDVSWQDFARSASRTADGRRALRSWRETRRLLSLSTAKRQAVAELLARHRDARTLVFTADNQAAYAIAREQLVMPITCDIGRAERDEVLAEFRRGRLRALVSARVLNEGLDVPDADVAIIVGGSLGEREHVQRVGRLLRPAPGKQALVYELVTRRTFEVRQARNRRKGLAPRAHAVRAARR